MANRPDKPDLPESASGERWQIGDYGPGGGVVFLTPSTDPDDGGRYAEMALAGWHRELDDAHIASIAGELILPWLSAVELSNSYAGGGFTNWRLPTVDEMEVIYSHLAATGMATFMPGLFWSSTVYNESYAYYTMPYMGEVGRFVENKQHPGRFRPVRYFDDSSTVTIDPDSPIRAPSPVGGTGSQALPWDTTETGKPSLGSVGPGGGVIFWVDDDNTHPNLEYLELGPPLWAESLGHASGTPSESPLRLSGAGREPRFWVSAWSNEPIGGTDGELPASDMSIGGGLHNTVELSHRNDELGDLARLVLSIELNGFADWYLPSLEELEALCYFVATGDVFNGKSCPGTASPGYGLEPDRYLTSNAGPAPGVWNVDLREGKFYGGAAGLDYLVRPIRGR